MADFSALKQSIQNYIKQNGNKEITGAILQNILLSMVTTMGDGAINEIASDINSFFSAITTRLNTGALYAGYATPSTTPAVLTSQEVFYLATQAGTYTNFRFNDGDDPIVLTKDGIYFIVSGNDDDDWNAEPMLQLDDVPTASSNNPVKSGGVAEELALGAVYDVSAKNPTAGPNDDGKWESLSALLSDTNLNTIIPTSVRKGGMSIKFIQSSDNKYVQYRCVANEFTTDMTQWQGVDAEPTAGSHNLVESGKVAKLDNLNNLFIGDNFSVEGSNPYSNIGKVSSSGAIDEEETSYTYSEPIKIYSGCTITVKAGSGGTKSVSIISIWVNGEYYTSVTPQSYSSDIQTYTYTVPSVIANAVVTVIICAKSNKASSYSINYSITNYDTLYRSFYKYIELGCKYQGIASPSTSPYYRTDLFYLAMESGEYTHFLDANSDAIVVDRGLFILTYNGSYWSKEVVYSVDALPIAGSANFVDSGKVYGNNNNTKLNLGSEINNWEQGVVNTSNPFIPQTNPNRICSRNNVVYKGCVIKYSVPVGYNISFATYDGENTATIQDSGWMSSQIGTFTATHKYLYITIRKSSNGGIIPSEAPRITIKDITNTDAVPTLDSEKVVMSGGVKKEFLNYIDGYKLTDGDVLISSEDSIVTELIPLSGSNTLTVNFIESVTGGLCAFYNANKEFINDFNLGTTSPKVFSPIDDTACYFRTTFKKEMLAECTVVQDNNIIWKPSGLSYEFDKLKKKVDDVTKLESVLVNSRIFNECKQAWADKDNVYESWPFGGVFADVDDIVMVYNSRGHHLEKVDSDVIIRKKKTLSDWYYKATIIAHDSTYSYGNPVCCKMPNGDYFLIVCCTNSSFVEDTHYFKMMKSSDKGETWTDLGFVQVNGENVEDECMMSLYCTSTGKLISFVGGITNCKFIASDDGGVTWRYVGETTGNGTLEAGFLEISDGNVLAILRKNLSNPALIRLNSSLTSYEVLYDFGVFAFPAWFNPTSITDIGNRVLLLGASRRTDGEGNYLLYEATPTVNDILSNYIVPHCILKYPAEIMNDWGYAQAVRATDLNIYAYFYAGKHRGNTQIYEMIGCSPYI